MNYETLYNTIQAYSENTESLLLDIDLGETQGIYINIAEKTIEHLKV